MERADVEQQMVPRPGGAALQVLGTPVHLSGLLTVATATPHHVFSPFSATAAQGFLKTRTFEHQLNNLLSTQEHVLIAQIHMP